MEFTVLTYNPSKHYMWVMHKKGCADIKKELKGVGTESGFPASDPVNVKADSWKQARSEWIDEELREMGWGEDAVRVCPCCKK